MSDFREYDQGGWARQPQRLQSLHGGRVPPLRNLAEDAILGNGRQQSEQPTRTQDPMKVPFGHLQKLMDTDDPLKNKNLLAALPKK